MSNIATSKSVEEIMQELVLAENTVNNCREELRAALRADRRKTLKLLGRLLVHHSEEVLEMMRESMWLLEDVSGVAALHLKDVAFVLSLLAATEGTINASVDELAGW